MRPFHPILSGAASRVHEDTFFNGDAAHALTVMRAAGRAVAQEALRAYAESTQEARSANLAPPPGEYARHAWIFFGKGHNGADALFAARHLADAGLRCHLVPAFDRGAWAPPVCTAYDELRQAHPGGAEIANPAQLDQAPPHPLVIDGLLGSGFAPPLAPHLAELIGRLNMATSRPFVVAVDLPSGTGDISDATGVRADLTVATGICKTPLLADEAARSRAGRIRYADLGFFNAGPQSRTGDLIVSPDLLAPLRAPLSPLSDKRAHGHVAIFGGAPTMPGALLMNTLAALHAGAGLVTAHAPSSVQPAFAATAPEALWVPVTEAAGTVQWETVIRGFLKNAARYQAVVCGSGMGDTPAVAALARTLIREYPGPLVLDADALRPAILVALADRPAGFAGVTLTPHAGEFRRISGGTASRETLRHYVDRTGATVVLKGPGTRVAGPGRMALIPYGGPALARGGSGDILAGMIGARLAGEKADSFETVCRAAAWHGLASDHLATTRGALTLRTTDLLGALGPCLRAAPAF